jgi:precorrin-2 dehydrogenase/sirohydrochlorin ferrochelatase
MQALHLLPISLNLQDKRCVVVGGENVAEKRVRSLLACGAAVQVVSPALTPGLTVLAQQEVILWTSDALRPEVLAAAFVVFVVTHDQQTNAHVARLARQYGCLVNVADDPAHCDFYMPAVVRRNHLTLAISTEGQAPGFAAWLRSRFERQLSPQLGDAVVRYARLRPGMRQRYPDLQARAQAWERFLTAEAPPLFLPGSTTGA